MEAEVEAESRIHELQLRVEELEKLREVDHTELAALRESEQAAASELEKVKEENSKLAEEASEAKENSKNALQAKEKAEAEKRDLLEALSRSDSDKQQLENNLAELQAAHSATQASLRSMEASYSSATENERSYKLRLQGLEGEMSILKKDRDWNHEELLRVTDEAAKDRREKNAQISTLQSQLDAAVQTSESATTSLAALKTSHATLEGRLSEAQARISTLTSQLADNEASFRAEIATAQRLTDLLEKREIDTKNRLEEVEREWQAAREEMQETREAYEAELEKEKARGDTLEERVREMRDFADRLAANGGPSLGNISNSTPEEDIFGGSPRSPASANVSFKVQKSGGMSYTEIYSSYVKMQEALVFEKAESKRLSECLNDILAEIQDRAPLLREQRNEYERALAENNDLSVALASALEDKDAVTTLAEARLRQIEEKDREAVISAQQLEDTARQVRTLTRQVAILQDPSILERSGADDESEMTEDADSADAYISQNLVTFKSIDQLQKQNQNLLKIVRELGKKMEAEEQAVRDRIGKAENSAVEEAHDLILTLKEEVESQRAQMGAYQRERDMLRQVLKSRGQSNSEEGEETSQAASTSQGGSNAARVALEEVQRNFEAYKREMVIDNQSLRDDLSSAKKEVSQLHIQVARSKAEKEYAEERLKTLRDSNERVERELAGMSRRNLELQSNMARLDDATRRVSEEVYDLKSNLDRARHEAMMLKAEKEVWKNVEARLTEDNATLAKERSHMSDLMRNLQAMHNELDRTGNEARQRLEENIARLNKELENTKDRLSQEVDAGRQTALRRELEGRELQEKIEKLSTDYHETREAYLNAKNVSERAVERAEAMQRQVAAYEEKLAVYEGRRGQSSDGASSLSREQQLETQLADIRAELGTAKMEAEQARGHVEQYKSIAQAHEQALAELNATYDEYKRSMEATATQKDNEISALQERVQALTNDLTASSDENSQLHRQLQNQKSQFEQEQQANLDTINNLRHFESEIEAVRAASKSDLEAQLRRANEAHDRYQAEVVAHAEDVQALTAARKELASLQSSLMEAANKAETAQANLASSESSWSTQREALQKEIDEQNKRCEDLIAQNSILHDHLESVSTQAALIKQVAEGQEPANGEEPAAPSSEAKTVEELHAVIRYVRRERDVAELRLHLSKQEESRMRQQLEQAHKRLDELTVTLAQERQQASEQSASAVQHAELMEKIQSLNLLRESNETLRREAEAYLDRVKSLESRLRETELELSPLREQVRVLQAEVEARDRNISMLEEDNARWKTRTQQILQKYERIDPAELASLKEELEKVKAALAEAEKERNAEKTRAEAIQTDLQDANTRAEASQNRFKSLQKIAREHRDNHTAAQAEFEKQKMELQAEVEQLKAAKSELEAQITAAQNSTAEASAAGGENLKNVEAERDALQGQLQSLKEELAALQELSAKSKEEEEASRKKLEEDMALQTRRNAALLADNKKFRAQIQELNSKVNTSVEEEVQKRLAALPEGGNASAADEASTKAHLSELEARLTTEKDEAVKAAVQEVESRLREQFAQEKSKLAAEAAVGAGGTEDPEAIQKRIDEAAEAKVAEAVRAKEEELNKAKAAEIAAAVSSKEQELRTATQSQVDQAKKQVETTAQNRMNNLAKQHKEAVDKLQKTHDDQLKVAVEEARAAASNQEAGEIASGALSQEDLDKAVKEAVEKKEQEHQKALAEKVAEAKEKAKTEFDLKSKLRDSQIAALRKETASLKARLAQSSGTETASSPQLPSTPAQPTTPAPTPAANGSPIKGLIIAGRSQSQGSITPAATPAAAPATVLSIAGASATTPVQRGRGRGRGVLRGGAPGAGRGRGNIVGTALSAATEGGAAKRAREDESADGEAKRRKDGEA